MYGSGSTLVRQSRLAYDALNHLQKAYRDAGDTGMRFEYDPAGNMTRLIDALDHATIRELDSFRPSIRFVQAQQHAAAVVHVGRAITNLQQDSWAVKKS